MYGRLGDKGCPRRSGTRRSGALLDGNLNLCLILPNGGEIKFANDEQTQPENGEEEDE
jgi:hypothetical protein